MAHFLYSSHYGRHQPSMWIGIVIGPAAVPGHGCMLRGDGETVSGTGSSYYFAEQSFLNHNAMWRYARLSKFIVGWASHLYYWIYPGSDGWVMGILWRVPGGTIWPTVMTWRQPTGPMFMMVCAIIFSFLVAYIAYRGINGSTPVNIAINVIQITALLIFSVIALGYRMNHPPGSVAFQFDATQGPPTPTSLRRQKAMEDGKKSRHSARRVGHSATQADAAGKPVPFQISYPAQDEKGNFLSHPKASSVTGLHNIGWAFDRRQLPS